MYTLYSTELKMEHEEEAQAAVRLAEQRERQTERQTAQKQLIQTLGKIYKLRENKLLVDQSFENIHLRDDRHHHGVYITPGFIFSKITSDYDL